MMCETERMILTSKKFVDTGVLSVLRVRRTLSKKFERFRLFLIAAERRELGDDDCVV